jgi:PAS domain S-box-containing protein
VQRLLHDLDGIVWVLDAASGAYTYVSEGIRLLGYAPEDWLQDPGFRSERLHPEDREAAETEWARVVSQGGSFGVTYRARAADGSWRSLHDVGHTITDRDGGVSVRGDRAARAEAAADEERFRDVVEHLTAIVYLEDMPTTDEVGRMLYVSPQVEELLGFTREEWLADPVAWSRQFHPDDRDRSARSTRRWSGPAGRSWPSTGCSRATAMSCGSETGDRRARRRRRAPVLAGGVMFDVTEQHETREQLADTQDQYRALVEQIAIVYREAVRGDDVEVVYINSTVEAVLGITPWSGSPTPACGCRRPSRRPRPRRGENRRTESTGDPFVIEYRMIARDARRVVPRRGDASCATISGARVLAGRDDRHHGAARGRGRPRRAEALPGARRAAAGDRLHRPRRPARHRLHQPADRGDPRVHPRRVVREPELWRRSCTPRTATDPRRRAATRTRPATG